MMKNSIHAALLLFAAHISICAPISNKRPIDKKQFEESVAVIRAHILKDRGECDKYCWIPIEVLKIYKCPKNTTFPKKINIAFASASPAPPLGYATLYLVYYISENPKLGWKLLSGTPITSLSGFSHCSTNTAEQGAAANP
jgi:hypothetical protein